VGGNGGGPDHRARAANRLKRDGGAVPRVEAAVAGSMRGGGPARARSTDRAGAAWAAGWDLAGPAWRPCLPGRRGRDGGATTAGGAATAQLQRAAAAATTPLAGAPLHGPIKQLHCGEQGARGAAMMQPSRRSVAPDWWRAMRRPRGSAPPPVPTQRPCRPPVCPRQCLLVCHDGGSRVLQRRMRCAGHSLVAR